MGGVDPAREGEDWVGWAVFRVIVAPDPRLGVCPVVSENGKNMKKIMTIAALAVGWVTASQAQFALVSASLRPAGAFVPVSGTNQQFRLEDCRIDPLAGAVAPAGSNRFQLTATLNRIYTDPNRSGPRLGISLDPGYPLGFCNVKWTEDEITRGYHLQSSGSASAPNWQNLPVQMNGGMRSASFPSSQVSTQRLQFFHLVKP